MKDIDCIFCGVPSFKTLIEENGFTGKQCPNCDLVYISPRPTFAEVIDLYGHNDAHLSAENHITAEFSKRLHAKHTLGIITKYINSGDLLEIGSGAGFFLDESKKSGFEPHGIEFNPIQADHIRDKLGYPCQEKPLGSDLYGGKKFDLIYHCDVISHLYEPIADFEKMNQLLNDGGYMVFETGNWGEIDSKYFKYIKTFMYPDHLFFFNRGNLKTLLSVTHFDLLGTYNYSQAPSLRVFHMLNRCKSMLKNFRSGNSPRNINVKHRNNGIQEPAKNLSSPASLVKNSIFGNTWRYFRHFLRYHVGKVAPKYRRPQTIIVVARKPDTTA